MKKVSVPLKLRSFPIVLANCITDDVKAASYIPNDYQGQADITYLIVEKGYKKPLFLHIPQNYIATAARKQGFEEEWAKQPNAATPVHFFMPPDGEDYFEGARPLLDLLEKNPQSFDFDVVICGNDRIAFVAYQLLLAKGFRIPQDVAVTGYDNMVGVADLFLPPLTTVQLPHYEMGVQATLHLIEAREGKDNYLITCPLIMRESC
ncbi:hypothetical protein A4A71_09080 [Nicoletella semolina]|nr:hypothetical protein [Nicoletella semolina]